jgi:hypothetical protein
VTSLQEKLQNLQKVGSLKAEPPDPREFAGLVRSATRMLEDAGKSANSADTRFSIAYDAAHSLALAALRWHGYRPEKRYLVFELLLDTASFPAAKCRVLSTCHGIRNAALYEGSYSADERLIGELIAVTNELKIAVEALGPIKA